MKLSELPDPSTPAARAALAVATRYHSPALLHHSVRSYLWGAAMAVVDGIEHDAELLYVAALMHDLGLVAAFDSHALPFEDAGGHVAWVLGAGAGWAPARCDRAAQVIVAHMHEPVAADVDPESHLLHRSTGLDISGRGVESVPADLRAGPQVDRHGRAGRRLAGTLVPQPEVVVDGRRCRLDEVLGGGFAELRRDGDAFAVRTDGGETRVEDPSGTLDRWLRDGHASAVVLRPDRIVRAARPIRGRRVGGARPGR